MAAVLIDPQLVEEIRQVERAMGRNDLFSGFVAKLEDSLAAFPAAFADSIARGDEKAAVRAAHTLKGTCRQLGALALGDLFGEIESAAKLRDFSSAQRKFDEGAELIARSLEALKRA
jgi:HPt (histidine-containing phosphotransfer) domain-containing protein